MQLVPQVPDTAALRKARGAFFTPEPIAQYITDWAVRDGEDRVLEPSCGEAAFLLPAAARLRALSTSPDVLPRVDGAELHDASATSARASLIQAGADPSIKVGDFFQVEPTPTYDAVIGNPPYVRYQDFAGESRTRARAAALAVGVPISNLASSWAAFTVHAALFLRRGGRLGLVLPAELLTVNYAAPVRRFLMERFASVELVLFEERVFPGVLEEVVLLMAEGYSEGPTDHFTVAQARNASTLAEMPIARKWTPADVEAKWTPSLLSSDALDAFTRLTRDDRFGTLHAWGETTLGMVTGANRYFALSPQRVAELGLAKSDLIRLSPPGSRHLRGLTLTTSALTELGKAGAATYLFRPKGEPSEAARRYIASGEATGVNEAYKCRIRPDWWRVPLVAKADLFLTYMNADTPRLCTNAANAHHLNSVHGVYAHTGLKELAKSMLPLASINSMTLVGAETVGRAYGGGMLKIEPREADRLPMPGPELVASVADQLDAIRPQVGGKLRSGKLTDAAKLVDDVLLVGALGLARSEVRALRTAHAELTARRVARGGK